MSETDRLFRTKKVCQGCDPDTGNSPQSTRCQAVPVSANHLSLAWSAQCMALQLSTIPEMSTEASAEALKVEEVSDLMTPAFLRSLPRSQLSNTDPLHGRRRRPRPHSMAPACRTSHRGPVLGRSAPTYPASPRLFPQDPSPLPRSDTDKARSANTTPRHAMYRQAAQEGRVEELVRLHSGAREGCGRWRQQGYEPGRKCG